MTGETTPKSNVSYTVTSDVSTRTTPASSISTTSVSCTETEVIEILVKSNLIQIHPTDSSNKQDLISKGLDIIDETSTLKIDLPEGGLIIRDVKISSLNIIKIEVVFISESGATLKSIQGKPTSLPINQFPTERIGAIIIKVLQTSDNGSLKQVKLSIIACEETFTTTSTRKFHFDIFISSFSTSHIATKLSTTGKTTSKQTTTIKFCDEMEYISTLIATNSVRTIPTDLFNKEDLISKGVDFTNQQTSIVIDIPKGGAIVRDVKLLSRNVVQIEVIFTTESGLTLTPIRGAPTSLSTNEFPTEKVREIVIKIVKTSTDNAPQDVTLSVIACAEGSVITSSSTSKATKSVTETTTYSGQTGSSSTIASTTKNICDEMEFVSILIANNAISITPVDLSNKEDLIRKGVNFKENNPIFVIDIPKPGAVIRDIKLSSKNVLEIEVIFKTESGVELKPIQGTPTALPQNDFPTEKVREIIVIVKKTRDDEAPQNVTLSVIACAEDYITTTLISKWFRLMLFQTLFISGSTPTGAVSQTTETGLSTQGTSSGSSSGVYTVSQATASSSTQKICDEIEYIDTLIVTNSIKTAPKDISNKQDLITKGVYFTDENPTFTITIPTGGAVVRAIDLSSNNVAEIEVIFTIKSGQETISIRGAPTSLPANQFPTEKVSEIIIKVNKTTDNNAPEEVTLSIIACAEGTPTTTPAGKDSKFSFFLKLKVFFRYHFWHQ